jgi:hypothetical protein
LRCQDPEAGSSSKFLLFNKLFLDIGTRMGWDLMAPLLWREYLEDAGFTDIHIQWYRWPIGPWAKNKKNKILGQLAFINFFELLSSIEPLYPKYLDWTPEETQIFIAEIRKEMREQKVHLYQPVCFCYAKKPGRLPMEQSPTTVPVTVPETAPLIVPPSVLQPEDVHMAVPTAAPETVPETVPTTGPENATRILPQ